jgi:hypothetical protein
VPCLTIDARLANSSAPEAPLLILKCVLLHQAPTYTLNLDRLGSDFMVGVGRSWTNSYKKRYGSLFAFVNQHPTVFDVRLQEVRLIAPVDAVIEIEAFLAAAQADDDDNAAAKSSAASSAAKATTSVPPTRSAAEEAAEFVAASSSSSTSQSSASASADTGDAWFDFNDGNVRAVLPDRIVDTFGGSGATEVAYMCVYRRCDSHSRGHSNSHNQPAAHAPSAPRQPDVPAYLRQHAEASMRGAEARSAADSSSSSSASSSSGNGSAMQIFVTKLGAAASFDADAQAAPLSVDVDAAWTVAQLRARLAEVCDIHEAIVDVHVMTPAGATPLVAGMLLGYTLWRLLCCILLPSVQIWNSSLPIGVCLCSD